MTFENDDKRREFFIEKLREKLTDSEFRKIEGFPIASDENILALSDPPYYTACPNPFLADFIDQYGCPYDSSEPYHHEPFAVDVSEGKTDQLYRAHGYHTKVPHLAIVPSILHYTKPGGIGPGSVPSTGQYDEHNRQHDIGSWIGNRFPHGTTVNIYGGRPGETVSMYTSKPVNQVNWTVVGEYLWTLFGGGNAY